MSCRSRTLPSSFLRCETSVCRTLARARCAGLEANRQRIKPVPQNGSKMAPKLGSFCLNFASLCRVCPTDRASARVSRPVGLHHRPSESEASAPHRLHPRARGESRRVVRPRSRTPHARAPLDVAPQPRRRHRRRAWKAPAARHGLIR